MSSPRLTHPLHATSPPTSALTRSRSSTPSLAIKPDLIKKSIIASAASPGLITQKEWVIPPRPKPGRKPATDTPPTKRKAQNRAAQRAFRERRAARVGELEGQIKEIEEKEDQEQNELKLRISSLENDVQTFRSQVLEWRERCQKLEHDLYEQKQHNVHSRVEDQLVRNHTNTGAVPLLRERLGSDSLPKNQRMDDRSFIGEEEVLMGCGSCTSTSRCACVEQALNLFPAMDPVPANTEAMKRNPSPLSSTTKKRPRKTMKQDLELLETDFTNAFPTSQALPYQPTIEDPTSAVASPINDADRCGFCKDGTPCMCAEIESNSLPQNPANESSHRQSNALASVLSLSTPPPSEGDVAIGSSRSVLLPLRNEGPQDVGNTCNGKPGSCTQCIADPQSTLFCKSLAASQKMSDSTEVGCCGGGSGLARGCCQSAGAVPTTGQPQGAQTELSMSLSCADAYTVLSRHPGYEAASDELGSWMGKLKTRPPRSGDRSPMEIEAASVMGVLKLFDRRFGRGE